MRMQEQRGERMLVRAALAMAGVQAASICAIVAAAAQQARKQRQE